MQNLLQTIAQVHILHFFQLLYGHEPGFRELWEKIAIVHKTILLSTNQFTELFTESFKWTEDFKCAKNSHSHQKNDSSNQLEFL